jgi:hypothetical protein
MPAKFSAIGGTMGAAPVPQQKGGGSPPTPPTPQSPVNKIQVEQACYVALAGAIGGLLFWVLALYAGTVPKQIATWHWYGQVSALMFISAIAGLFGVYLLTASQVPAIRTFIFAIVCGLLWQPIIDKAKASAGSALATHQTENVNGQTALLKTASSSGNTEQVSSAVKAAVPVVTQAIKTLPDVQDAGKTQELVDSSQRAITELQAAANKAPDSSVGAIKEVGIAASEGHRTDLAMHAVQSLREIGLSAADTQRTEVVKASVDSLQELAVRSSDPEIKDAALKSLKEVEADRTRNFVQPTSAEHKGVVTSVKKVKGS